MKRVKVYLFGETLFGKVLPLPESLSQLKEVIEEAFSVEILDILLEGNFVVKNIDLIRDDDTVFAVAKRKDDDTLGKWLTFNVGGQKFMTTRTTLISAEPESLLVKMLDNDLSFSHSRDSSGAYLIDRSPVYFECILHYLRTGMLHLDGSNINVDALIDEARFYGIQSLVAQLDKRRHSLSAQSLLTRDEFAKLLISTDLSSSLRCQGISLSGLDLSKMDLQNINFSHSILDECDFSNCNLSNCNFEHASLRKCNLSGALLFNARFCHANLEDSRMIKVHAEDGNTRHASFEGARMANVDLCQSYLSGVNMRLANLQFAKFRNCSLRETNFANSNLAECDFSAADLTAVNMRGANLAGVKFDNINTPLHNCQYMNSVVR